MLKDRKGPFGNPFSDSERTIFTSTVDKILITIFDFRGDHELAKAMEEAIELFQT